MPRDNPCHYRYAGCEGTVGRSARCCEACRHEHNRRAKARRDALREQGRCLVCGKPVAKTKRVLVGGRGLQRRVREPASCCPRHLAYFAARAAAAGEST